MNEKRIYAVVAGTIQVPVATVIQPPGRQIAQVAHVVSKLRHGQYKPHHIDEVIADFEPMTTIVLQARDSGELRHVQFLLLKKKLNPVSFFDTNRSAYGDGPWQTAIAVLASKRQVEGILDYLPLWK